MSEKLQQYEFKPVSEMSDAELQDTDRSYRAKLVRLHQKAGPEALTPEEYRSLSALESLLSWTQDEIAERMSEEFSSLSKEDILNKEAESFTEHREAFERGDFDECDKLRTKKLALRKAFESKLRKKSEEKKK